MGLLAVECLHVVLCIYYTRLAEALWKLLKLRRSYAEAMPKPNRPILGMAPFGAVRRYGPRVWVCGWELLFFGRCAGVKPVSPDSLEPQS